MRELPAEASTVAETFVVATDVGEDAVGAVFSSQFTIDVSLVRAREPPTAGSAWCDRVDVDVELGTADSSWNGTVPPWNGTVPPASPLQIVVVFCRAAASTSPTAGDFTLQRRPPADSVD